MEIKGTKLEDKHIGSKVTYVPRHADNPNHPDVEGGTIASWNDEFVFVDYGTGTNKATPPELLMWG